MGRLPLENVGTGRSIYVSHLLTRFPSGHGACPKWPTLADVVKIAIFLELPSSSVIQILSNSVIDVRQGGTQKPLAPTYTQRNPPDKISSWSNIACVGNASELGEAALTPPLVLAMKVGKASAPLPVPGRRLPSLGKPTPCMHPEGKKIWNLSNRRQKSERNKCNASACRAKLR